MPFAQHMAGKHGRKLRKDPLSDEVAESESLQRLLVKIRRPIRFWVCRCDVCNRLIYAFFYRGCEKSVDVARMRPAEHRGHARDLSAFVDLVSHLAKRLELAGNSVLRSVITPS